MLRSTCLCGLCHVYAYVVFIMFVLKSTCLCLDLCACAQIYMFMCSMPCFVLYMLFAVPCASKDLLSLLCLSFLRFGPYWWGVDLDPMVQDYIHTPWHISKGLDHFLYACLCLLLCFMSMLASLDLGFAMLCAPRGLVLVWLHPSLLRFAWMQPLVRYMSLVLVCLIHTFLLSVRCLYACLDCFVPPVWLSLLHCIFARLPTCSCISLYLIHTPIQWNCGHSIQTYICPPRTPPFV